MCAPHGFPWYLLASTNRVHVIFEIKVYDGIHSCTKKTTNSNVTSTCIANKMESQFKVDPNLSYDLNAEFMMTNFGV
jgi:hypothetical protein